MLRTSIVVGLSVGLAMGCSGSETDAAAAAQTARPSAAKRPHINAPSDSDGPFEGQVSERLPAGSYSYMRVTTRDGAERWVVTLGSGHAAGTPVKVRPMGVRTAFKSRRLKRTFGRLLFAIVTNTN